MHFPLKCSHSACAGLVAAPSTLKAWLSSSNLTRASHSNPCSTLKRLGCLKPCGNATHMLSMKRERPGIKDMHTDQRAIFFSRQKSQFEPVFISNDTCIAVFQQKSFKNRRKATAKAQQRRMTIVRHLNHTPRIGLNQRLKQISNLWTLNARISTMLGPPKTGNAVFQTPLRSITHPTCPTNAAADVPQSSAIHLACAPASPSTAAIHVPPYSPGSTFCVGMAVVGESSCSSSEPPPIPAHIHPCLRSRHASSPSHSYEWRST